nr:reverse transcriptase domain-containing protein [Tanacetum cinerariifolium]
MSYLSEFKEISGGYVAFGGNLKGGKITCKCKIRTSKLDFDDVYFVKELKFNLFNVSQMHDKKNSVLFTNTKCTVLSSDIKLLDDNHVLLRVPRENNMYNVDLKNSVPSADLTCLFAKATLDKVLVTKPHNKTPYELLLGRTPSIGFMRPFGCPVAILNTLDPLVKELEFEGKKPEYEVCVSPSSSAKTKKHDDKTTKEAKGKSPVELSTGFRNLSEEFEYFSDNNINEVNAASTPVPVVGQISTSSTNTFSAARLSNTVVSPTLEKSSYVDPFQYPDEPNMPALEDITYYDNEEDVGAEADFTNLETTITFSPIPTTRVHKDHPVTQIIGDLSFATQTRSMTRMVKDHGGLTQINNKDFHAFMFAFCLSQKEPKRVHQAIKDPSWIELCRRSFVISRCKSFGGKIDQTLFIKKQKGNILLVQVYANDIIFGSTDKDLCKAFEKLMKDKFQMSSMGKLTFLLGLQVKQKPYGIFISKDKYVAENLRKFGLIDRKSASIPIDTNKPLLKDPDGEDVDVHTYRSMIGSLMYLTSSRPNIMFSVASSFVSRQDAANSYQSWIIILTIGFLLKTATSIVSWQDACMSAKRTTWNEFSSSMALTAADGVTNVAADDVDDVVAEDVVEPTPPSPTPTTRPPPPQEFLPHYRKFQALEKDKVAQAFEIKKLKQRVKKLERKNKLKVYGLRRLKKVGTAHKDDKPEPAELKEVIEVVTTAKLMTEVVTAAVTTTASTITAAPNDLASREKISLDKIHSRTNAQQFDVVEDFKEYTLRDYYYWLKTYCYWYKLLLLDNAADLRLRLLEQRPTIPTTSSPPNVVERKTEVTKDTVPPTNNESTKDIQPLVVQVETQILNSEPVVEPFEAYVSAPKSNSKPSIPYPSRLHDQKLRDKTNDQKEKFFQIFQDLNLNISFTNALILMPKFSPTIKSLLTKREKLFKLARTLLNEHCSAVLLKKLPENLRDAGKFLIPCDIPRMDECLVLADLGASINLMPLSVWNKLSFPKLSPTSITFNLDQTSRYSANYHAMSINQIDVIDVACEEYFQEVLGFSISGNPTPSMEPIFSTSSPTLTCNTPKLGRSGILGPGRVTS